uniref:E3 ubiquitin ligase BIG BROTHER-related-like isoform X2 n=1 Tax=Rhizophora mucronata TaxID=61149 RepID=A0A2P2IHE5_RHIMU
MCLSWHARVAFFSCPVCMPVSSLYLILRNKLQTVSPCSSLPLNPMTFFSWRIMSALYNLTFP